MQIFLGSSTQRKTLMVTVAAWIEDCKHKPLKWTDPETFPAGTYTLDRLVEITEVVQGAVFVFGQDDEINFKGEKAFVPRDNVICEYGLFVGKLGIARVAICCDGIPKNPSDLNGITYIDISEDSRSNGQIRLVKWLETISISSLSSQEHSNEFETTMPFPIVCSAERRERLGADELAVLNLILAQGRSDEFAMTISDIVKGLGHKSSQGTLGTAEVAIGKLLRRGHLELEPSRIKSCYITEAGWRWIVANERA